MHPQFETMEDYLGRLPRSEQAKIRAGSKKILAEIKQARAEKTLKESLVTGTYPQRTESNSK